MKVLEFAVAPGDAGRRIDQIVSAALGREFSRTEIHRIMEARGVSLNGKAVTKRNTAVKAGDAVRVEYDDAGARRLLAEDIPLEIVREDDDVLVINKPAGMVVHPAPGHWSGTVVNALVGQGKELSAGSEAGRPGIVHRLDKDTSGLIMIAKNDRAHRSLTKQLQNRTILKIYDAVVLGRVEFEEGFVDAPIGLHPKTRLQRAVRRDALGKEAYTEYGVVERMRGATLLSVRLHTGRTHQIRVHMAHLGHPVLGDHLYGPADRWGRLALHAAVLEFDHPAGGERVRCEAPAPADFMEILEEERKRA